MNLPKIFDVRCPCHLANLCAQEGAKALPIQVDQFVIDLFYHFQRSAKRKATLGEYMAFTNTEVKKIIKLITRHFLSSGKFLGRTMISIGCFGLLFSARICR